MTGKYVPLKKQNRAHRLVRDAIKKGLLVRPSRCPKCGNPPAGTRPIHGHHADYDKPLEVEWMCAKCHRQETPFAPYEKNGGVTDPCLGEANGIAKLTDDAVRAIRSSPLGCILLGRQYGVDKKQIQRIRRGESWTHVK